MNVVLVRAVAAGFSVGLLAFGYRGSGPGAVMSAAAHNFLASLSPEQRTKASFPFADDERFNWHYIPKDRKGLPLSEMTPTQKHLASALLSAGLSRQGFIKAASIMSLEDVLRVIENDSSGRRDPEKYYFSLFGDPSDRGAWGYRIEGHHLSLHFTIVEGRAGGAPTFLGTNPAWVKEGPRRGLRVLEAEEELGRELLGSLEGSQKQVAIVDAAAYPDILTSNSRKAAIEGKPNGLPAGQMNAKQRALLDALVSEYAHNLAEDLAEARVEAVRKAGRELRFAWAGSTERGKPHYYRIQAPSFLIEYDNTQNNANHIHSVWRDFDGDFGADLLRAHYAISPHDR
jgi:hypothetical protein